MAQKQPVDPWGVASVAPIAQPSADPWGVASTAPTAIPPVSGPVAGAGDVGLPQPTAHPPVDMQPSPLSRDGSPGTVGQKLFGDKPLKNTATVVGQSLKNLVTAPYHAIADAPANPGETAVDAVNGRPALAAYRMLAEPTVEGQGADRIPIVGPWARNVENNAKTYGAIPALAGLATDVAAPKAAGGLFGGAAKVVGKGMQAAASTPEAMRIAATRGLVTGSPGEMLNRSLKPPVTKPDFEQSIEQSLPSIAAQNPKGVTGFAQAAQASKQATNDIYQNIKAPHVNVPIDASPIYNAQMNSIPITNQIETGPQIFKSTDAKAGNYKQPLPLGMLDDVRMDTNAKLNAFYNKNGGDKYAALSDPETARTKATNDTSRDLVYSNLSRLSGVPQDEIAANQNLYGNLSDVAEVAGKRATVAGRANPLSLQESLQLHGNPISQIYNFGTSRLFKNLTDSDAVTNAAVNKFQYPNGPNFPTRPGLFPQALADTGKVVDKLGRKAPILPLSIAAQGSRRPR